MQESEDGNLEVDRAAIWPLIHWHSQVTSISISSQRCMLYLSLSFFPEFH
jgi:hypothetical protein